MRNENKKTKGATMKHEIKSYVTATGRDCSKGRKNRTFTKMYELYIDGRYVDTFDLLRDAKKALTEYENGKTINYPFSVDPIFEESI